MTELLDISPGLQARGFTPPLALGHIKLLVFGMDSAMLYPGAEELAAACAAAGIVVNQTIGETTDGLEKQGLLVAECQRLNIGTERAMVIGRAASDVPMMMVAGVSVAFMAPLAVAASASIVVTSGALDRVLQVVTLAKKQGPVELDLSVLDTLVNHDPVKFKKFALLFIDSIETVLTEIDAGIASKNLSTLMGMGHRAKSTAKNIGAEAFSTQCLRLEQTAREQDLDTALQIAAGLRPQFETIREAILRRLASSG
jgi:HPt (histidine-containing phosphotransfer) domain-containing protein